MHDKLPECRTLSEGYGLPRLPRIVPGGLMLGCLISLALALALVALSPAAWAEEPARRADPATVPGPALDRLVSSYPEQLAAVDGNVLVWRDGMRMPVDDGRGPKSPAERLQAADIKDMLIEPYPRGSIAMPPGLEQDPGRARNGAFFDKMYGACATGAAQRHLTDVVWLPKKWGKSLKATRINGVADRLAQISRELDALSARFDRFLYPPAGTFNCRSIAGTNRPSAHGHGIAIDLAVAQADYWRWEPQKSATRPSAGGAAGRIAYRNRIPEEIVAIFERHGFIWGGRWYHYDTMHFEYRPELLATR